MSPFFFFFFFRRERGPRSKGVREEAAYTSYNNLGPPSPFVIHSPAFPYGQFPESTELRAARDRQVAVPNETSQPGPSKIIGEAEKY